MSFIFALKSKYRVQQQWFSNCFIHFDLVCFFFCFCFCCRSFYILSAHIKPGRWPNDECVSLSRKNQWMSISCRIRKHTQLMHVPSLSSMFHRRMTIVLFINHWVSEENGTDWRNKRKRTTIKSIYKPNITKRERKRERGTRRRISNAMNACEIKWSQAQDQKIEYSSCPVFKNERVNEAHKHCAPTYALMILFYHNLLK